MLVNDNGRILDANQAACDLLGYESADVLGRALEDGAPTTIEFDTILEESRTLDAATGELEFGGETRSATFTAVADITIGEHLLVISEDRKH